LIPHRGLIGDERTSIFDTSLSDALRRNYYRLSKAYRRLAQRRLTAKDAWDDLFSCYDLRYGNNNVEWKDVDALADARARCKRRAAETGK